MQLSFAILTFQAVVQCFAFFLFNRNSGFVAVDLYIAELHIVLVIFFCLFCIIAHFHAHFLPYPALIAVFSSQFAGNSDVF